MVPFYTDDSNLKTIMDAQCNDISCSSFPLHIIQRIMKQIWKYTCMLKHLQIFANHDLDFLGIVSGKVKKIYFSNGKTKQSNILFSTINCDAN